MKRNTIVCFFLMFLLLFTETGLTEGTGERTMKYRTEEIQMKMTIGETLVEVAWENNDSVKALKELAANSLSVQMSMYGGFEQVGSIGSRLPRNDQQTVTESGDIVLYSGDQIVVFYGSNSWTYTRLGKITDKSADEMRELLSHGNVTITITSE